MEIPMQAGVNEVDLGRQRRLLTKRRALLRIVQKTM